MVEMLYVVLFTSFSLPLIFTLVAASISHFLTAAIKFSCHSSNEIGLLCFLPLALAPFLLSTQMKTLKLSRRKESASLMLFFISKKSWNSYAIYSRYAGVRLEMQNFTPELHETVDLRTDVLRTDDFLRTKISWMHSLPNFLTHGARCARFASKSSDLKTKSATIAFFFSPFPCPLSFFFSFTFPSLL